MLSSVTVLAPILWTACLLLPADGWRALDGLPLDSAATAALAAVWWLAWSRGSLPGRAWLPAALIGAKLAASPWIVPHGFEARYYANAAWAPPHERSVQWRGATFTRRDARLDFGRPGAPDLPLHFFHDSGRFNVATRAGRDGLPFSIAWRGVWHLDATGPRALYLAGEHLDAAILVDGRVVVDKPASAREAAGRVELAPGWHTLEIRASAPHGLARRFEAGVIGIDGTRAPFGPGTVYAARVPHRIRLVDARLRAAAGIVSAAVLAWLAAGTLLAMARHARSVASRAPAAPSDGQPHGLALAAGAAAADALWFARRAENRFLLLFGGDDMLTYATLARDIALDGVLMLGGQPAGQAAPFYYQPLFPYVLALTHVVFGEDAFGIFLVQRLGVWATWLAVWRIAVRLFGTGAGWVVLGASGLFLALRVRPWTGVLLAEPLFVPLLALAAWALVVTAQGGRAAAALAAGALGGLATLTRSTLLAAWPLVLPLVAIARRRAGAALQPVVVAACLVAGITGLATLRNWVAAGQFVPVASSFGINFLLGNPPPPGAPAPGTPGARLPTWLPLDEPARAALEGALHAPGTFAANLGRKALYALGVFEPYRPGAGWAPVLVATWLLALAGMIRAARSPGGGDPARWIPAAFAAAHLAAVVAIFPHAHGDRLILPLYVLLLPYIGALYGRAR